MTLGGFLLIVLATLFIVATLLPLEIRAVKFLYRALILVWADEVKKAWQS